MLDGYDLIMQSATGSGKTEALLAPCLERIIQSGRIETLIYIVPTRALAFDLKRRLEPIVTQRLGLQLSIRTGDIKRSTRECPDLMLTTPESLDVLLGSANSDLRAFVSRVRMIIIDEIHQFIHNYRGRQLAYLITRLERRFSRSLQKMALSATIADVDGVIDFFGFRPDTVRCVTTVQRDIVPHLVHLKNEDREFTALLNDLYDIRKYRKILIFANSRGKCDRLFSLVNAKGRFQAVCELHYSNLKARERRAVERRFRKHSHAICIATSTLELGIDIGDVDGVLLYEPPDSIAAFLQRIGRANRRGKRIHFWGICRGEKAGLQLLRFCGLLIPARKGAVERPLPAVLPSVLVQQVLSCIYEKKYISLPAMQELFPAQRDTLEALFASLIRQGWLESTHVNELFQGGWRYRRCLFEHQIWGNFPETEDNYALELPGEAVADLPWSIVRQLDPGDRVYLAGRRLQILHIDTGARKRVLAQPSPHVDDKKIAWLGTGVHVSYEVAQSMRALLKTTDIIENSDQLGLFSRTRKLLDHEAQRTRRAATLENGIEVFSETAGGYHYRTFLGSIGNLIIQYTIQSDFGKTLENLDVTANEIGLICSHRIDFSRLTLPLNHEAFVTWTAGHLKILRALFSLNRFSSALPRTLLIDELTDLIFDPRLAEAFSEYRHKSSRIVSGTLEAFGAKTEATPSVVVLEPPVAEESLLAWEKRRWGIASYENEISASAECRNPFESMTDSPLSRQGARRPLTATIVGEYIRHQQCQRCFRFHFLPPDEQPPRRTQVDNDLSLLRIEQGRQFEAQVLTYLERHSRALITIREQDENDCPRPLKTRFEDTCSHLRELIPAAMPPSESPLYLSQGVFMVAALLATGHPEPNTIDAVGIPDLIRISLGGQGIVLQIGDIKSSRSPRYDQKWQVAFYAWLLHRLICSGRIPVKATVHPVGFLLTPPQAMDVNQPQDAETILNSVPQEHAFDLAPFMAAFPLLFENLAGHLERPVSACAWQLQPHCTACDWFEACYRQALATEDIQFLPQLTPGELSKIRTLKLNTLHAARTWFETSPKPSDHNPPLLASPQAERLQRRVTALTTNQIALHNRYTRLLPTDISTVIVMHGIRDPLTSLPCAVGWRVADASGHILETRTWEMRTRQQRRAAWPDFSACFSSLWQRRSGRDRRPHVFYFGTAFRRMLRDWAASMDDMPSPAVLWQMPPAHWTDLRQLISRHFDLPIAGTLTLFALSRMLGLEPESQPPESLFHRDTDGIALTDEPHDIMAYLEDTLIRLDGLQQWALKHLKSDGYPHDGNNPADDDDRPGAPYLDFIDTERRHKEEDMLTLQQYPLAERVARFRAIGPLTFQRTTLDDEGGFLHQFKWMPESGLSKFREGDFLKLAPAGLTDLQSGFSVILARYDHQDGCLAVRSRQGHIALNRRITYSLEEDLTDWNDPKLKHVIRHVFGNDGTHPLPGVLQGRYPDKQPVEALHWIQGQLHTFAPLSQLNAAQQNALVLPFTYRMSLIEGPPGTGKTFLAGWILISLIRQAHTAGIPLRIVVSALTHQAIDNVLQKVVQLVNTYQIHDFPARCIKFGRWNTPRKGKSHGMARVETSGSQKDIMASPYLILGATGYGLYQLLEGRRGTFPEMFDWVVFDEASQMLVPQALLSLIYGKGRFLFLGDVKQLPPIVLGDYEQEAVGHSILRLLMERYPAEQRIRLDVTYRMNDHLCRFPSRMWYDGMLHAAPGNADARLTRAADLGNASPENHWKDSGHQAPISEHWMTDMLDPEKPVVLVLTDHQDCHQVSMQEADLMAQLAFRLMTEFGLHPDQLALISPHRAQNNAIAQHLGQLLEATGTPLPLIDTVERVQGAERDVILFAFTTSDPDHTAGEFLNNPNRFNVAITRAKRKLIVIGSRAFFSAIPQTEKGLQDNACFKEFLQYCRKLDSVFVMEGENHYNSTFGIRS